jgi:hypothetical protein
MAYDVRYGQIRGSEQGTDEILASGLTIVAASSKFMARSGEMTATVRLAIATDTMIVGHMEVEAIPNSANTGSSLGTEVRKVIVDQDAIFRVPILSGTYVSTMKLKRFDLHVANPGGTGSVANVQGITLTSYTYGHLVVVGGDLDDQQFCDVKVYAPMLNAGLNSGNL